MKKIELISGGHTLVDDADFDWLNAFSWTNVNGYAARTEGGKTVYMHREIMESPARKQVDHKNGDKLDNRRQNLRHATPSQNCANRSGWAASGFKGVVQKGRKWQAHIRYSGKLKYLGRYSTPEAAAIAYNGAARSLFGEFAALNDVS